MINHAAFNKIWNKYDSQDIPFLTRLKQKMKNFHPYQGMKVFHNIPLSFEAVIKIEPLLLGGADIVASCVTCVSPNQAAVNILNEANVKMDLDKRYVEAFDVYLDCCAEMIKFPIPSLGTVELTQTGSALYKNSTPPYPVISIDDSILKNLETIGTGHSCVKAIIKLTKQPIDNKKVMVFGYGKVGKGIVKALKKCTKDIVVVEKDQKLLDALDKLNFKSIAATNTNDLKRELKNTYCIISATGIKGCISNYFDKEELAGIYLANAGAEDEFGAKFSENDVLFSKRPVNFSLDEPTLLYYLDPILYAHNIALDLLLEKEFANGYHQFPDYLAKQVMNEWAQLHNENLEGIFTV